MVFMIRYSESKVHKKLKTPTAFFHVSAKMSTIRAFQNNIRIATGRVTKDGRFFQAYPNKMYFNSEQQWRDAVSKAFAATFMADKPVEKVAEKPVEKPAEKVAEYSKSTTQTLPAGKYYIGDLCYAMKDKIYDGIFGGNDYAYGYYTLKNGCFLVDGTAYGDGSYQGTNGFDYGVDAGIIGIASLSVCNAEEKIYGGTVHTLSEPVLCTFNDGIFEFSSGSWYLKIDTTAEFDDDASY